MLATLCSVERKHFMNTNDFSLVLAIDLGGTNCRCEALRWDGNAFAEPLAAASVRTPSHDGDAVLGAVSEVVRLVQSQLPANQVEAVAGIGIGVPGLVDTENGVVLKAVNLGWHNRDIQKELESEFGVPVVVLHDVTSAGVAEQAFGAGRGAENVLSVFLGTGIAATVTVEGNTVRGGVMPTGFRQPAGEIGHMPIIPDGIACACGQRGCLEMYCSARSFGRLYSEALGIDPNSSDAPDSKALFEALEVDPIARQVWSMATRYLAHGLLMVTTVFGPTKIVLGGGLSAAGDTLVSAVVEHFDALSKVFVTPQIVTAQLGSRAGVLGVGLLTRDHVVAQARARAGLDSL